jgi:carbon-monoxide dehydrogenase large subunit
MDNGQGHPSAFAQVAVSALGIPYERLKLQQSDSDQLIAGAGSGGSRSLMATSTALIEASDMVIAKGRKAAAHLFETNEEDVIFARGVFSGPGSNQQIGILELADELRNRPNLPPDVPGSLDVNHVIRSGTPAFPNGCHIAEVEVDPDTGTTEIVRYTSVGDFGNLVNPMLVEGQLHGGIVQGIGQALFERTVYDDSGQLLTGSFMDYAMPRASDVPDFGFVSQPTPALTNPLGVKGCGEAGCAGALGSVMNALVNALSPYGIRHIDMPATPERVWQAIQEARQRRQ